MSIFFGLVTLTLILASSASCADWPGWRGPTGDGVYVGAPPVKRWSESENVAWKTPVAGVGHSSPIVVGERVFLTACEDATGSRRLLAVEAANGELAWDRELVRGPIEPMHRSNNSASSTPASDGRVVVATFAVDGQYFVAATDLEGDVAWRRRLGPFVSKHGIHSCPVIHEGDVLLAALQDSDASFVARLDAATGETIWQTPAGTSIRSFAPPHVSLLPERTEVVVSGANRTAAFDFVDGTELWSVAGPAEKTVSSIVEHQRRLLVPGGRDSRLLAIDRSSTLGAAVAWFSTEGVPYVPSPILHGDAVHLVSDEGVYTRVDVASGKRLVRRRLVGALSSSPVLANGLLYVTDESGQTVIAAPRERGLELVAKNDIGEPVYASLAIVDGVIYLRGASHLYRIEQLD